MSGLKSTVIITGGTSGLGFQCAFNIARQFPEHRIVLASRTDPDSAAASINKTLGQNNVEFRPLDLSSFAKIRSFVTDWEAESYPPIQALVLNAAVQLINGVEYTDDGIEKTFGVNHVGHALLFHLLQLHLADGARVVITASSTHDPAQKKRFPDAKYTTAEELAHPTAETAKNVGVQRYATSKLCNVMWAYALHRRFARVSGKKWTVTAFDPGLMPGTGFVQGYSASFRFVWFHIYPRMISILRLLIRPNIHSPQESGAALAWLAVGADVEGVSGVYYEGRKEIKSSEESYDEKKQEDLWDWTVKETATSEMEARKFGIVD